MLDQRKKVMLAVAGSVGLHVLLFLLWALAAAWLSPAGVKTERPPDPIKLTIEEEKPEPTLAPVAASTPPPVRFMDSTDMVESATPPPDAKVQSAKNTAASSELPAEGGVAMPTQRGRKVPTFTLKTTEYLASNAPSRAESGNTPPSPPVETAPPLPHAIAQVAKPLPAAPQAPAATPPAKPGDFALAQAAPTPAESPAVEANPYDPSFRAPTSLTEPPRPTPVFASNRRSGYQPQQYQTAASGSITNRGPASVATAASPLGRYQSAVTDAIRRRWYAYVDKRADLASMGNVKIHFLVGMDGRARGTKVVANTANEALASLSLQAILDAKLPPMPAEAVPGTSGGQLPMDLTFEFIDSSGF